MNRKIKLVILILCAFAVLCAPIHSVNAATVPTRRPTPRYIYVYGGPRPVAKKKQSLWDQIVQKVGPAILGSGGVILGAVVAWYTLRRKTKAFDQYFNRIARAQEHYRQETSLPKADKEKAMKNLKGELVSIQEEVELAVAKKKLDQEQLIAVSNKIERILGGRG